MTATVLYCTDPLNPRQVDPHFATQATLVRDLGGTVARIDHDALLSGRPDEAVAKVPRDLGPAWYRGWMIPSGRYAELATALAARGCTLLTSPDHYQAAHELPGWYSRFAEVTPRSVWQPSAPGQVPADLAELVAPLGGGPGLVKDYVKSRKHEWDQACFVPELADTAQLHQVVRRFVELQEDFLAGGIVVRAFEQFSASAEARVWWVDGQPVLVGPHPDTPEQSPDPDLSAVAPLVAQLGCRFVTTDLAVRTDGTWRVIEVGDGQVSDLPQGLDPTDLFAALLKAATR